MRTPWAITLSAPITTSSPIATPSWIRTWRRTSQRRPMIAPSTTALWPTYVAASITERAVRAPSRSVTLVARVEVRLPVLVEVADVLPVALADVAVDRAAHLEQEREELLREVVRPVGRHVPQDLRLEHVDAGVDRVREDLAPGGLLEEALDPAVVVGDDDPELERVVDRLEADRDGG